MATMNQVIEYVDRVRPNVFTDEDKYSWLSTLEALIARRVRQEEPEAMELPRDGDMELSVPHPYDEVYRLYAMAMVDFYNREYDQYNNTAAMFEERLGQYEAWYIRNNPSCNRVNFKNVN